MSLDKLLIDLISAQGQESARSVPKPFLLSLSLIRNYFTPYKVIKYTISKISSLDYLQYKSSKR